MGGSSEVEWYVRESEWYTHSSELHIVDEDQESLKVECCSIEEETRQAPKRPLDEHAALPSAQEAASLAPTVLRSNGRAIDLSNANFATTDMPGVVAPCMERRRKKPRSEPGCCFLVES